MLTGLQKTVSRQTSQLQLRLRFLRHLNHVAILQPEIVAPLRAVRNVHGENGWLGGFACFACNLHA